MGGFSLWHWLIVLVIVVVIFGTKRLRNVGSDLGEAVKGFKKGMHDDGANPPEQLPDQRLPDANVRSDDVAAKQREDDRNPPVAR